MTNPAIPPISTDDNAIEEWRIVEEFPHYEISNIGRLRRCKPDWQGKYLGRIRAPSYLRGYAQYAMCVDGRIFTRRAHALVCTAFNGPRPDPSYQCAHRDDDKTNNTPGNLYWATPKQNMADAIRNGRVPRGPKSAEETLNFTRGDDHWTRKNPGNVARGASHWRTGKVGVGAKGEATGAAKLTEEQAKEIIAAPTGHGTGRMLAEKFGVSMGLISAIRKGRAWAYLRR